MIQPDLKGLHQQQGATLLEALISMVVVAFGLLGVLSLQLYTIKAGQSAQLSSMATLHAYELFDLMRANRTAALKGKFDDGSPGDRAYWQGRLSDLLGTGTGAELTRQDRLFTLTITWDDSRGAVVDAEGNASTDASGGKLTLSTEI